MPSTAPASRATRCRRRPCPSRTSTRPCEVPQTASADRADSTVSPLSSTWVRPTVLGFVLRSGRLRNVGTVTLPILHVSFTFRQTPAWPVTPAQRVRGIHEHRFERRARRSPSWPAYLRSHPALRAKSEIKLVSEVLGAGSWVHGPGDDGAVVALSAGLTPAGSGGDQVIACGEALLPAFVAVGPLRRRGRGGPGQRQRPGRHGCRPAGNRRHDRRQPELAREALRGMSDACGWYDVALAGGHLTLHDGAPAVSAFGVGRAAAVLSTTNVAAGQSLIVAACTDGDDADRLSVLPLLRRARRQDGRRCPRPRRPWPPRVPASPPRTSAWPASSVRWRCCSSGASSG